MTNSINSVNNIYLKLAGGTMTGNLILNADPTVALGAVTKQYVDAIIAGLTFKDACYAASTVSVTGTFVNLGGIGDTLTNSGAQAAFSIDSVSPPLNSRILLKNQATTYQNGIYVLTVVGTGATNWVLTRATDYDTAAEIQPGDFILIDNGTVNAGTAWIQTAIITTMDSDSPTFSQFGSSAAGTVTSVATGTGLRGGTITSTGTINLSTQNAMSHRLTLTSGTPVTTNDVTAVTTLYLTPYKGTDIDIYSGAAWIRFHQAELSITNSGLSANLPYDVFIQYNAGTPQLSLTAWTNTTTRATALAYQDGVLVLSGTTTSRYLGTILTDGASKFQDAAANRSVWNYYNRVTKTLSFLSATTAWTYGTATWRQANANPSAQLNFVIGVVEDIVAAQLTVYATLTSNATPLVALGVNTTTSPGFPVTPIQGANQYVQLTAFSNGYPNVGSNYIAWLEYVINNSGTVSFKGTETVGNSGMTGGVLC